MRLAYITIIVCFFTTQNVITKQLPPHDVVRALVDSKVTSCEVGNQPEVCALERNQNFTTFQSECHMRLYQHRDEYYQVPKYAFPHICAEYKHRNLIYKFQKFYPIKDMKYRSADVLFEMHFAAKLPKDALLLLSTNENPSREDQVLLLVIGGVGNKKFVLRKKLEREVLQQATLNDILSDKEFRAFYIRIYKDNTFEAFHIRDDKVFPIFKVKDERNLTLNYYSFSTWGVDNQNADFYHDCMFEPFLNGSKDIELLYRGRCRTDCSRPPSIRWNRIPGTN